VRSLSFKRLISLLPAVCCCALADARPAWGGMIWRQEPAAPVDSLLLHSWADRCAKHLAARTSCIDAPLEENAGASSSCEPRGCPKQPTALMNLGCRPWAHADRNNCDSRSVQPPVDQLPFVDFGLVKGAGVQSSRFCPREFMGYPSDLGSGLFRPPRCSPHHVFAYPTVADSARSITRNDCGARNDAVPFSFFQPY
jgi:hypothetical protein